MSFFRQHVSRSACGFAAALSALLISAPRAQASLLYYVEAATRVQTSGNGISDPQFHDDDTGLVFATSITSGPFTVTSSDNAFATATASAKSDLGALHGMASFSASTPNAPGAGGGQGTNERWSDTFTVTSATLAPGTPVTLLATLTFHRQFTASSPTNEITLQDNASVSGPFTFLNISDSNGQSPDPTQSVSTTFNETVGDSFNILGQLSWTAQGTAFQGSPVSGSVDISNTALFNLVSLTPNASYTTASGVSYVPEPSSVVLAAIGLCLIGVRRRLRSAAESPPAKLD